MRFYSNGFTLLELILVLAIIGMAALFVIPHLSAGSGIKFKAEVRDAVAVLNYARRAAIVEGTTRVAKFYNGKQDAQISSQRQIGHWYSRGASLQWGGDVKEGDEQRFEVKFFPEGGSSGGDLVIKHDDLTAVVNINPITGKITTQFGEPDDA